MSETSRYFNAMDSYGSGGASKTGWDPPTRTPPINFLFENLEADSVKAASLDISFKKTLYQIDTIVLKSLKPGPGEEPRPSYPRATILPKSLRVSGEASKIRASCKSFYLDGVEYQEVSRDSPATATPKTSTEAEDYPRLIVLDGVAYQRVDKRSKRDEPVAFIRDGEVHVQDEYKARLRDYLKQAEEREKTDE